MEDNKSLNLDKKVTTKKKVKKVSFKLSRISRVNLKGVDSRLVSLIERVIAISKFEFSIPVNGGFRIPQVQNNLFHQKKSKIDGFKRQSPHQVGRAFNICIGDNCDSCDCDVNKYKQLNILFQKEFSSMKEEGIFDANDKLSWGNDNVKVKNYYNWSI